MLPHVTMELPQLIVTERLTLVRREGMDASTIAFTIDTTPNRTSIGTGSLTPRDDGDWHVDVTIDSTAQGIGYGREAGRALVSLAFAELGAARVVVEVPLENERAQQLVEHLGFNGQGTARGARRYVTWRAPGVKPPARRKR